MFKKHLVALACPKCEGDLQFAEVSEQAGERVLNGKLKCAACAASFPIVRGIPRFVADESYSQSFGFQWVLHAHTQYDSFTQIPVSRDRLWQETRWPKNLSGEMVLEVGSGSGRFTEPLAASGALVVSLDSSLAVEANAKSNGNKDNVLIVQASIYEMPLRKQSFDRVLCIGVLQHTPDVKKSFEALLGPLKPGGKLAVDVYRHRLVNYLWPRYWIRPLTKRMPAKLLYAICEKYVNAIWSMTRWIHRLPAGRKINRFLLVPDFRGIYRLPEDLLKQWAVLDTFDNLSPYYDQPQTLRAVNDLFKSAGLEKIEVHFGFNGIEGRAIKSGVEPRP